ncbi:MAG: hypothetical protein Q4A32_11470 [Lachnospiraceae bacterium]|nr:hypothetical protein [Lachnospiraceae bacterium]
MNLRNYSLIRPFSKSALVILLVLCIFLYSLNTARAEGEFLLSIGDKFQIPCLPQSGSGQEYEILIENPDIVGLDETGKCIVGVAPGTTEVTVILYDPGAVYAYGFTVLGYGEQPSDAFHDGIDSVGNEWGAYETTEDPYYGQANADTPEQGGWEGTLENDNGQVIGDDTDRGNSGQNGGNGNGQSVGNDTDGYNYGQNGGNTSGGSGNGQSGRSDANGSGNESGGRSDADVNGNEPGGRKKTNGDTSPSGGDDSGSNYGYSYGNETSNNASGYSLGETESYPDGNGEYTGNADSTSKPMSDEAADCPIFFSHGAGKYDILVPSHYSLWISVRSRRPFSILYIGADGMPISYRLEKNMIYIKSDDIPPGRHLIQVIAANAANQIFIMDDYPVYR